MCTVSHAEFRLMTVVVLLQSIVRMMLDVAMTIGMLVRDCMRWWHVEDFSRVLLLLTDGRVEFAQWGTSVWIKVLHGSHAFVSACCEVELARMMAVGV